MTCLTTGSVNTVNNFFYLKIIKVFYSCWIGLIFCANSADYCKLDYVKECPLFWQNLKFSVLTRNDALNKLSCLRVLRGFSCKFDIPLDYQMHNVPIERYYTTKPKVILSFGRNYILFLKPCMSCDFIQFHLTPFRFFLFPFVLIHHRIMTLTQLLAILLVTCLCLV